MSATPIARRRSRRMELRTTDDERALIDRAVAAEGTDLTDFVVTHASAAARRVLADREAFTLTAAAADAWEELNDRPARELSGLIELLRRSSPFTE